MDEQLEVLNQKADDIVSLRLKAEEARKELSEFEKRHKAFSGITVDASVGLVVLALVPFLAYVLDYFVFAPMIEYVTGHVFTTSTSRGSSNFSVWLAPLIIVGIELGIAAKMHLLKVRTTEEDKKTADGVRYRWMVVGLLLAFVMPSSIVATYMAVAKHGAGSYAQMFTLIVLSSVGHISVVFGGQFLLLAIGYPFYARKRGRMIRVIKECYEEAGKNRQAAMRAALELLDGGKLNTAILNKSAVRFVQDEFDSETLAKLGLPAEPLPVPIQPYSVEVDVRTEPTKKDSGVDIKRAVKVAPKVAAAQSLNEKIEAEIIRNLEGSQYEQMIREALNKLPASRFVVSDVQHQALTTLVRMNGSKYENKFREDALALFDPECDENGNTKEDRAQLARSISGSKYEGEIRKSLGLTDEDTPAKGYPSPMEREQEKRRRIERILNCIKGSEDEPLIRRILNL